MNVWLYYFQSDNYLADIFIHILRFGLCILVLWCLSIKWPRPQITEDIHVFEWFSCCRSYKDSLDKEKDMCSKMFRDMRDK